MPRHFFRVTTIRPYSVDVMAAYKISPVIIRFLAAAMKLWKTDLSLHHEGGCVLVKDVLFKRGIYQGDSLSPLLFIISVNPISLLLNRKCQGYYLGDIHITHSLYMDDLKGFTNSYDNMCKLANLIESMSSDIVMKFGLSKCKCINIVKGKYQKLGGIKLQSGGLMEEVNAEETYQ